MKFSAFCFIIFLTISNSFVRQFSRFSIVEIKYPTSTSRNCIENDVDTPVPQIVDMLENSTFDDVNATNTVDPVEEAIRQQTQELNLQVSELEAKIRTERILLTKSKDKLAESGKNGFFMVQAQVNDFLRKSDIRQKEKVAMNKREFALKILPVIDSFRMAPIVAPATNEKETNMHNAFSSLLTGILGVLNKSGFQEFLPVVGEVVDPLKHTVVSLEDISDEKDEGKITAVLKPGVFDVDGSVLRRASVVASRVNREQLPTADDEASKQ